MLHKISARVGKIVTKENAENRPKYIDKRISGLTGVIIVVKK